MRAIHRVAIVAHDAGGAEVLSSHVRRLGAEYQSRCLFALSGPAQEIFNTKIGPVVSLSIHDAIEQSSSVLCGTGWQSSLELDAIILSRKLGKKATAFLDHWTNYKERFVREGKLHLPDEVWVGDSAAFKLAHTSFPSVPITLVENPYFLDMRDALSNLPQMPSLDTLSVLYVCEPVRDSARKQFGNERHWGYTEEEALRYFLNNLHAFKKPIARILIRQHPAETEGKYFFIQQEYDLPLYFSDGRGLTQEIGTSNCVVGCNSMAMVMGLLAGRQTVCCIPPGGSSCFLPLPGIQHLQVLANGLGT